ncbi:lysine-rich coiled-coil protein 1-like [Meriones unguiculatus]|uniref:lysine-rich coiled-coil protein 1-like n=1 Tax=Meriones unguiculatus TaxID=10047 RepID=UPI000B4F0407|nr:lysine-rich coiled-coil protein 1-like [Meriones unguiculatus]
MEKSQPNDSFERELEDFVRKQKARGLHPRVCFGTLAEDPLRCVRSGAPVLGPPLWLRKHPRSSTEYERLTAENPAPHCRQRVGSLKHHQRTQPVSQDRKEGTQCQQEGGAISEEPRVPKGKHRRGRGSRREGLSRGKPSAEPAGTEKVKNRKESRRGGRDPNKGQRWPCRERRAEEWDLWDEAILGSCC